jgi:hypothetical protein
MTELNAIFHRWKTVLQIEHEQQVTNNDTFLWAIYMILFSHNYLVEQSAVQVQISASVFVTVAIGRSQLQTRKRTELRNDKVAFPVFSRPCDVYVIPNTDTVFPRCYDSRGRYIYLFH